MLTNKTPNPGSPEAIKIGCKCPRCDNRHGLGVYEDENGNPLFWISGDCPIHGMELREESNEDTL